MKRMKRKTSRERSNLTIPFTSIVKKINSQKVTPSPMITTNSRLFMTVK